MTKEVESQVDNSTVAAEAPVEAVAKDATSETLTNRPEQTPLMEMLSEELRDVKVLKNFDSVDALAKSLINAQELVGKRVTDLSADELASINEKFGVPKDVTGYDFDADEAFKAEALEIGLSREQAAKLHEKQLKMIEEQTAYQKKTEEETIHALEKEFGPEFEAKMDLARKTALELGGDDLQKGVFDSDRGIDPKIIKALSEAGKRIFDHESIQAAPAPSMTLGEVNNEISSLLSKENREVLGNPLHGSHKAVKDKLMELSTLRNRLKRK